MKSATRYLLNIPPHLKRVATLPREIFMSENRVLCAVAILLKDELARILTYERQQMQF